MLFRKFLPILFAVLVIFVLYVRFGDEFPRLNLPGPLQKLSSSFSKASPSGNLLNSHTTPLEPDDIHSAINRIRSTNGLTPLTQDSRFCNLLEEDLTPSEIAELCPDCIALSYLKIPVHTSSDHLEEFLYDDPSAANYILGGRTTNFCSRLVLNEVKTVLVSLYDPTDSIDPNIPVPTIDIKSIPTKQFSETDLWQALTSYRQAHKKPDLIMDENLCQYARKRLDDHLALLDTTSPEDYPIPEKYPLDAHEGFSADAASGIAFDIADKNHLAENLAYWPSADYAHQVIEWGWDTSTEGHREAQLSEEYTHACVSGKNGFFVAIFGK